MLPSILAWQLKQGLSDYIKTTFPMTTPSFSGSIPRLLETKDSVFHEPYISVRLPFRIGDDMPDDFFRSINMAYVALTRAQKTAYITSYGAKSEFIS